MTSLYFYRVSTTVWKPNAKESSALNLQNGWEFWWIRKPCADWDNYSIKTPWEKLAAEVYPTFWDSNLECFSKTFTCFWHPDKNRKAVTKQHPASENKNSFGGERISVVKAFFRLRIKKHPWRFSSSCCLHWAGCYKTGQLCAYRSFYNL